MCASSQGCRCQAWRLWPPFGDWKQRWRLQVELGLFYLFSRHSYALLCVFQSVVTFPHLQDFYVFLTN